jgi:gas vesicle protein
MTRTNNNSTIDLFSLNMEAVALLLGATVDNSGAIYHNGIKLAERMCSLTFDELANVQQRKLDAPIISAPNAALRAIAAEAPFSEEPEQEGTLLTNEVVAELIQSIDTLRKRVAQLEMDTTARIETLVEQMDGIRSDVVLSDMVGKGSIREWIHDEIESQLEDNQDTIQKLIHNEVKSQIEDGQEEIQEAIHEVVENRLDDYDFTDLVADALNNLDLTTGVNFTDAVKSIIHDTETELDSSKVETIVNNMDLSIKLRHSLLGLLS